MIDNLIIKKNSFTRDKLFDNLDLSDILIFSFCIFLSLIYLVTPIFDLVEFSDNKNDETYERIGLLTVGIIILSIGLYYLWRSFNKDSYWRHISITFSIITIFCIITSSIILTTELISDSKRLVYLFLLVFPTALSVIVGLTQYIVIPKTIPLSLEILLRVESKKYAYYTAAILLVYFIFFGYAYIAQKFELLNTFQISLDNFQNGNRTIILNISSILSWGFFVTYTADVMPKIELVAKIATHQLSLKDPVLKFLSLYDSQFYKLINESNESARTEQKSDMFINMTEYYKYINLIDLIFSKSLHSAIVISNEKIEILTLRHCATVSTNNFLIKILNEEIQRNDQTKYFCRVTDIRN